MLTRLIDLFIEVIDIFRCWVVVDEFEAGILLRLGKFHREISPGFCFKLFAFDRELIVRTSITTMELRPQSLITKDGTLIVTNAIIKYQVVKAKPFLLEIWDATDVLKDVTMGALRRTIKTYTYEDIISGDFEVENTCARLVRQEVNPYGFKIHKITLTDFGKFKTIRLLQDAPGYISGAEEDE